MNNFTKLLCAAALATGATQVASAQTLYDNFETTRIVSYPLVEGTLVQNAPNPGSNAVNSSPTCASYARAAASQYAVLVVKPNSAVMASVAAYATGGAKRISVKFRSPAAGVTVGVVLQNSRLNTGNYPTGKFGTEFTAVTTVANAWETLTFTPSPAGGGNYDPTVAATDIDQMLFQVAPNSNNGSTYYLDDIMGPELMTVVPTAPAVRQLYDNYEGTRAIKYIAYKSSGGLKVDTLNNAVSAANPSARVARYTRSANQYDALVMQPRGAALADVTNFKNNTLHMTMKVFSPAPGIPFQLTLQDSTVATGPNYPAGRNSEYTATTTATNAWETLTFNYSATPSGTANTSVNEIVLLISSNTYVKQKVYIDDFYGPSLVGYVPTATRTISSDFAAFAPAYPNPTSGLTQLPFSLQKQSVVSLAVFDNLGRRVAQLIDGETRPAGQFTAELNAAKLAPGLYTCRLTVAGVALSRPLSVE
ncbi:MAG: C-terminal target protein [Hymenobacter sp.]|nr:C-terminal target protein [Hymenobacter sp.]